MRWRRRWCRPGRPPPWQLSRRVSVFLARRFGRTLRLMRNIGAFEGTLSRPSLTALALDGLLQRQVRALSRCCCEMLQ